MANAHGTPIWYELVTRDADAASAFYDAVVGWQVAPRPSDGIDYRMIVTAGGDNVGGLAHLTDDAPVQMTPGWRFYVGVDDVDATVAKVTAGGGSVTHPPFDMPGVGRMALVADPQGVAFYVMRGASEAESNVYDRMGMGKCNWNELATPDQDGALQFYADVFGWSYPDRMAMGDFGDYVFVQAGEQTIGAIMRHFAGGPPPAWQFYFRAPDIEAAAATVKARGGMVHHGPVEVPGGDRIIVASDPQGLPFGVVGPGEGASA